MELITKISDSFEDRKSRTKENFHLKKLRSLSKEIIYLILEPFTFCCLTKNTDTTYAIFYFELKSKLKHYKNPVT